MAQRGHAQGNRSPKICRTWQGHQGRGQASRPPHCMEVAEDWETEPVYINDNSRPWDDHEIATASINSDLSESLRGCSLGISAPLCWTDHPSHQRHHQGCRQSAQRYSNLPKGHQAPACPRTHSLTWHGIERSSLFNRNAQEKLDTFFTEKLKAWGNDATHLSDPSENTEAPQEAPPRHSRNTPRNPAKGEGATELHIGRKPNPRARANVARDPSWPSHRNDSPATGHGPGRRHVQPTVASKGGNSKGPFWKPRLSTAAITSFRISPQCSISHIQWCKACQEYNRDLLTPHENVWTPLQEEEEEEELGGPHAPHNKERSSPASLQQISDRLCKVQRWLEESPVEASPGHPRPRRQRASLGMPRDQKEGALRGPSGEAKDWQSLEPTRHRRKSRPGEEPARQPAARILTCDETNSSPATCTCLYCEQQSPRTQLVSTKTRTDPSAEEVARLLQAENRIPQIVEAFERRTLWVAKMAEQDRAVHSARPREPEKRTRNAKAHRDTRRAHRASSAKARQSPHKEPPREASGHQNHRGREQEEGPRKWPTFLDRLWGPP